MPNRHSDPAQQFQAVEEILRAWLKERRTLLTRYTETIVAADSGSDEAALTQRQKALCELLVDYTSAGHFEVFHQLINEAEVFNDGSSALAEQLMPAIGDTTEVILAYDEKYGDAAVNGSKLKRDLSALGEVLESRFALEDRLIAGLHNAHRLQAETAGQA